MVEYFKCIIRGSIKMLKMKWYTLVGIVLLVLVLGSIRVRVWDPPESRVGCRYCLSFDEMVTVADGRTDRPFPVFCVEIYDGGRYRLYFGGRHPERPEFGGGATMVRTGTMNAAQVDALLALSWNDRSPFGCRIKNKNLCIATNSVLMATHEEREMLSFVVTNSVSAGYLFDIEDFNPLVYCFLNPTNYVEFSEAIKGSFR